MEITLSKIFTSEFTDDYKKYIYIIIYIFIMSTIVDIFKIIVYKNCKNAQFDILFFMHYDITT